MSGVDWKRINAGCPTCGGRLQHHSKSWWCTRCGDGANWDGSVRSRAERKARPVVYGPDGRLLLGSAGSETVHVECQEKYRSLLLLLGEAREQLAAVRSVHRRAAADDRLCAECHRSWPCPTYDEARDEGEREVR